MRIWGCRMIKAVLLILAVTSPADAGDWELFEQRCLRPMEDVALQQPHDLEPFATVKRDDAAFSAYRLVDQKVLYVSDWRSDLSQWCALTEVEQVAIEQALNWAQSELEKGHYVNVTPDTTHAPITLQSAEWREPRIEVSIQVLANDDGPSLAVKETDLES